jgi:hypothetical protein
MKVKAMHDTTTLIGRKDLKITGLRNMSLIIGGGGICGQIGLVQ